jgi:predicted enzyme related to lactoylglutathione lyase
MPTRTDRWPAGTPCWLDISVPDVAAAKEFYGAVIGWDFEDQGSDMGDYVIASRHGNDAAGLGPLQSPDQPTAWMLYFAVDDIGATIQAVRDNGGQVIMDRTEMAGVSNMAVVADNQGVAIGLWDAAPMIGAQVYNEPGGLVWEQLVVPDVEAARAFYTSVFPLDFTDQFGPGVALRGTSDTIAGFSESTDGPPRWDCFLSVDDAVKSEAIALEHGGSSVQKVELAEWGHLGVVKDPWGARIGIGDANLG